MKKEEVCSRNLLKINNKLTKGGAANLNNIRLCNLYNIFINHSEYLVFTRNFCCDFFGGEIL